MDERAALRRRVDVKYAIGRKDFVALLDRLAEGYDALDISGDRRFGYRSVYFDTADLRCFLDHARAVKPRFKARTRHYVDSGQCVFEAKIKPRSGGTSKRQADHACEATDVVTPAAAELLSDALTEAGIPPPGRLEPVLETSFERITLVARQGDARLTADLGVRLARMDGRGVCMRHDAVLVETKSRDGQGPADRELAGMGAETVALSKYRTGIDALLLRDDTGELAPVRRLFG